MPGYDDPETIQKEEAREELLGPGGGRGRVIFTACALGLALLGIIVAVWSIKNWSSWVVLGAFILTLVGFIIALNPRRTR